MYKEALPAYWASLVSVGCMSLVLISFYNRGGDDWSTGFAVFWFGLWATAIVLALVGGGMGIGMRSLQLGWRVVAVVFGSATLLASLFLLWVFVSIANYLS